MKKILSKISTFVCAFAIVATLLPTVCAQAEGQDAQQRIVRVGLDYGSGALVVGNLQNAANTGYRFGYYDSDKVFQELGRTEETKISVAITQNVYLTSGGSYTTSSENSVGTLGCYHVQWPGSYTDFESAKDQADRIENGFVAWVAGTYYVRSGSYRSRAATQEAIDALRAALPAGDGDIAGGEGPSEDGEATEDDGTAPEDGETPEAEEQAEDIPTPTVVELTVGETSAYGHSVVVTGTTRILFQYDGGQAGETYALGVLPGLEEGVKAITWHKGYKYYGGFRFERINGANSSTIVNMVGLEDYVKGVIPYEMSPSWPTEALKAQAVAARSYMVSRGTKHSSYHFDVCTSTDCQVYQGTAGASEATDRAVDETWGQFAYYNGKVIEACFYSSNGGASEDAKNVWGGSIPYLIGKEDPYEADVADIISGYTWTKTYTAGELTSRLRNKGYGCSDIVDFSVTKYSAAGNAIEIKFVDAAGKSWTFSRDNIRNILGINSIHFTLTASDGTGAQIGYSVAGTTDVMKDLTGYYAINGDGEIAYVVDGAYAVTGDGTEKLTPSERPATGVTYTLSGAGWGHNVGLSQWGAYAMAKQGYGYIDILEFYYTGITVE